MNERDEREEGDTVRRTRGPSNALEPSVGEQSVYCVNTLYVMTLLTIRTQRRLSAQQIQLQSLSLSPYWISFKTLIMLPANLPNPTSPSSPPSTGTLISCPL